MKFPILSRLNVKICGITSAEQARDVVALKPDAIGLNFWPGSKRYVKPEHAEWALEHRSSCALVGVFVNPSLATLEEAKARGLLHVIQLHGDEEPTRVRRVMDLGLPVIKALQVRDQQSLAQIGKFPCKTILLDAYCPGTYGGEGKTFPWDLAIEAQQRFPEKHIILAGGLTPENVGEAVARVQPLGVDVASGVESSPGVKDLAKVKAFIDNARLASPKE